MDVLSIIGWHHENQWAGARRSWEQLLVRGVASIGIVLLWHLAGQIKLHSVMLSDKPPEISDRIEGERVIEREGGRKRVVWLADFFCLGARMVCTVEAEERRYWIFAFEDGSGAFALPLESKQQPANLRLCLSNQHNPVGLSPCWRVLFCL